MIAGHCWFVHEILAGKKTFNEIKQGLLTISANILSERLRQLEEDGLIVSNLYSSHPPRYEYELTESGRDLETVFHSFILWGEKHLEKCYKSIRHAACNHEIELRYYCPHCQSMVEDISIVPAEEK
ncbi:winged helix-turn-helix transcriptional regulator [Paenibacillus sp. TAB 01]|uniref:winged helix-turn-helix transcriptional regulator n=1 Tax=Paenibacillus sp. TAB 01 TaxID=3368988 RepID=UPI00375064EC